MKKLIVKLMVVISLFTLISCSRTQGTYLNWDDANFGQKTSAVLMGVVTLGIWPGIVVGSSHFFSENYEAQKDLEKIGRTLENNTVNGLAYEISERFGLSEDRSYNVSKIIYNYNKMGKRRSMTNADSKRLYQEVLGVSLKQIKEAMVSVNEGEQSKMDSLYEKIADKNNTSPEHMRDLVEEYMQGH